MAPTPAAPLITRKLKLPAPESITVSLMNCPTAWVTGPNMMYE